MTAARSSPTGPSESAQTHLNDSCVGSLSRRLAPFNTARGFSGRDAERSDRSLCPSKRRDARVASPHNTQRAACSHPVPGKHSHPPRRRVVPYREERRVFRLSLAALPSELGKGEEHTQSVLSQEDDGQRCWLRHSRSVLRRSPHEDVEQVVDSSDASRDRERESRSSFARRPSISMQQHRERA